MASDSPFRQVLEQAEEALWLAFKRTDAVKHSGLTGSGRERAVEQFLAEQLPARFVVAKGEAFDFKRQRSAQLDLVIYDQMAIKPLQIDSENSMLPAEALLAVVEVKTRLTREETRRCFVGARKLGELRPYGKEFVFSRMGGVDAKDKSPRCLITVFSFETDLKAEDWAEREWDRLREVAAAENVPVERLDRVIVLNRGLIVPPGCSARAAGEKKGLLREWFLHLTNFLAREAGRREPFEWQAYDRHGGQGWIKLEGYRAPTKKPRPTKASRDPVSTRRKGASRRARGRSRRGPSP
ncbi:MAG: DUF6602 domain-containing protein [Gaiellales bacterium]